MTINELIRILQETRDGTLEGNGDVLVRVNADVEIDIREPIEIDISEKLEIAHDRDESGDPVVVLHLEQEAGW